MFPCSEEKQLYYDYKQQDNQTRSVWGIKDKQKNKSSTIIIQTAGVIFTDVCSSLQTAHWNENTNHTINIHNPQATLYYQPSNNTRANQSSMLH